MAWITSINRRKKSPFIGDIRVFGEFEDKDGDRTICTVDGYSEQECVEYLANMQSENDNSPYYRLVMYSEIFTDSWS